ncbi:MAG: glycosyltransferase family 2 protein [Bacteroidales bacterium]|nr:glycosyltransferase family 2 protein [Bacteroidales bacterium]
MKDFQDKENKNIPISIIIAIYNASTKLHRCIDSILAQTYTNFELILVDDGSTDCSATICDKYALQDKRVRVFHKTNGGVSSAREFGTRKAKGTYTIHVDSDDWIEPTMLEELYKKAIVSKADMVICNYILELPHKKKYILQEPSNLNTGNILRSYLIGTLHAALWNKLIKKDCYKDIHFPIGINYKEDMYVICNMIIKNNINSISYLNKAYYHYNNTDNNNITSKVTNTMLKAQIFITDHFAKILEKEQYKREITQMQIETKRMALDLGTLNKKDYIKLYDNINKDIKVSYNIKNFIPTLCLYISVNGMYKLGYFLLKIWDIIIKKIIIFHKRHK